MWLLPKQQKVAYKGNINQSDGFTGVHTFCNEFLFFKEIPGPLMENN